MCFVRKRGQSATGKDPDGPGAVEIRPSSVDFNGDRVPRTETLNFLDLPHGVCVDLWVFDASVPVSHDDGMMEGMAIG